MKKLLCTILLLVLTLSFTACSYSFKIGDKEFTNERKEKTENDVNDTYEDIEEDIEEDKEDKEDIKEDKEDIKENKEDIKEDIKEDKEDSNGQVDVIMPDYNSDGDNNVLDGETNVVISDNWYDMEFILDGVKYTMPFAYSQLKDNGYSFDIKDYGYDNGYIMNKGDKVSSTIDLINPKFGDSYKSFQPSVGFINNDDNAKDIYECDIWAIDLDIQYGSSIIESYPSLVLSQGLKWGSSEEDVLKVFGEPEYTYRADELGYTNYEFSYREESTKSDIKARLTITDEFGLSHYEIKIY